MTRDLALAEQHARAAVTRGQATAADHATLGWAALNRDDDDAAHRAFHAALALTPRHPDALIGLANILRRQGRLRDAVLHCDAALAEDPRSLDAWLERGFVLSSGGSMAAASECYSRVLALDSAHAAAHAGLAAILARDGKADTARVHAMQALATEPGNLIASGALAQLELEAGDPAATHALLAPLLASLDSPSSERALLANLLGDAAAKLGQPVAAYAAYHQSKADFAALHRARFTSAHPARDLLLRLTQELKYLEANPMMLPPAATPGPNHLFLLGFPRSGTTLAENILASLPGVQALEELPTLGTADRDFLAEPGGLRRLAAQSEATLEGYRGAYWQVVSQALGGPPGHAFVDMDPLKGSRLPLIARLFPAAKVLIMRRDPRDVVWSCFHTHFALTNAALDFTALDSTARYYAAMMTFIERACQHCDLHPHVIRYEALVQDFAGETQRLCDFAALPWSEALLRFDRTAQRRGVATASAGQVRKGLYDGSGQWRPFAEFLQPVLPILQPWIERFGYEA